MSFFSWAFLSLLYSNNITVFIFYRLVEELNPFPGMKHLDVAGGTGHLTCSDTAIIVNCDVGSLWDERCELKKIMLKICKPQSCDSLTEENLGGRATNFLGTWSAPVLIFIGLFIVSVP